MNNNINNMFFELYTNNAYLKEKSKNETKEREEILSLATMLKKLESTVSHIEAFSNVKGTDINSSQTLKDESDTNNNNWPSPQNIASALSALAAMIQQLTKDKEQSESQNASNTTKNLNSILDLKLQQMEETQQLLEALQQLETTEAGEMSKYQNWINSMMSEFNAWWNYEKGEDYVRGAGYTKWVHEPQISDIENAIEKWFKENYNITIKLDPNATSLAQILNEAQSQLENIIGAPVTQAYNQVVAYMNSTNDPALMMIAKYLAYNQKIDPKTIQELSQILEQTLKVLSEISNIGTGQNGPSTQLLLLMLNLMTESLGTLQTSIAETSSDRSTCDATMAKAFNEQAQQAYQKVQEQLAKLQEEEAEQKSLGIFSDIIGGLITLLSLGAGSFVMAGIMAAMTIMQATGVFHKLSTLVASALIKDGMSKKDAQAVADAIVTAIVIVTTIAVSAGTGALSSLSEAGTSGAATVGSDTAESAAAAAEDAVAEESESVAAVEAEQTSASSNLAKPFKAIASGFKSLPPIINLAISTTIQAAMATNLAGDATVAAMTREHKSQSEIQKAEMIVSITTAIVGMILSTFSASALTSSGEKAAQATTEVDSAVSRGVIASIKNSIKTFENFMQNHNWITTLMKFNNYVLGAAQVGSKTALGISKLEQANAEIGLGKSEALEQLMQYYQKAATEDMNKTMKSSSSLLKSHENNLSSTLSQVLAFEATYAQIMAQSA